MEAAKDPSGKRDAIEAILEIELRMFLSVPTFQRSRYQDDPEEFKRDRRAQFSAWSFGTLQSTLDNLRKADAEGKNLATYKYARMDNLVPADNKKPCQSLNETSLPPPAV